MCGVTIKDRISIAELRERLGICSVTNFVRRGRLGWFGQVERRSDRDWVKSCRSLKVSGEKVRGRSRKTWEQCVNEDMKELGLKREETLDRNTWYTKVFRKIVLLASSSLVLCPRAGPWLPNSPILSVFSLPLHIPICLIQYIIDHADSWPSPWAFLGTFLPFSLPAPISSDNLLLQHVQSSSSFCPVSFLLSLSFRPWS